VLTGLAFFSQHGLDEWQFNVGDAATLFCAVMWGMYITYTDKFMRDAENIATSSARLTLMQFIISCVFAFMGSMLMEGPVSNMPSLIQVAFNSTDFWIAFLYTAILASIVATYIPCCDCWHGISFHRETLYWSSRHHRSFDCASRGFHSFT
jgi:drug/metabolite transporter (DMT)-like permease